MSKTSVPKNLMPAVWLVAIAVIAIAAIAGSSHLRPHNGSATQPSAMAAQRAPEPSLQQRGQALASMEALPLAFEANQGQTDSQVKYLARGDGYTVFLTASDAVFALHSPSQNPAARTAGKGALRATGKQAREKQINAAIDMKLVGGNRHPQIAAGTELPGRTNYFIGNDPQKWQRDVKQYTTVSYKDVYPGVALKYHGQQRQLEFDFIVAPGASVEPIRFKVAGAKRIATDAAGNLVLSSAAGDVLLHKPVAYQEKDNTRQPVGARFSLDANNTVSFELGNYDRSRELVIDPSVSYEYSTYLGGTAEDDAFGLAIDSNGNAYVTGQTASTNFPTVAGSYKTSNTGGFDAFVSKVSANGTTLIYSTYVGGTKDDSGNAIAVDASGDAFVAGGTASSDFPTTTGAFQTTLNSPDTNGFVFELSPSGASLTYSTYLGGSGSSGDVANGIAVDGSDEAYVVGSTSSTDFPVHNAIQGSLKGAANAFVTKFNASGGALVYSTYLGGGVLDNGLAVALDTSDDVYVTGLTESPGFPTTTGALQTTYGGGTSNAFVTVINAAGSSFVYSTFLGGSGTDEGHGIAVDSSDDAYVAGLTTSSNFPVKSAVYSTLQGTQNAFVSALNPAGGALIYSTYLGGNQSDAGNGIAVDEGQYAYVTGETSSGNFPVANATQATLGGANDAFVSEFSPTGSLVFSTYLGGLQNENTYSSSGGLSALGTIAVDSVGANIYVAGNTASANFPVSAGVVQGSYKGAIDAFVAKYSQQNYTVAATTPTSVTPGNSTTSTVTLTSLNSYSSSVNLTCTVTAIVSSGAGTPLPTCNFTNASVTPTSAGATTTLNLLTTGPSGNKAVRHAHSFPAIWLPVVGISLLGIPFASAKTGRRKFLGLLMLCLAMSALFMLPSCGGSSGSSSQTCAAAPSVPTGLADSNLTSTSLSLSWTASTVGSNCSVSSYTIYQNGTSIGTSATPSVNVTGLSPSTQYSFTVSATDSAGTSAQSSPLQVTTPAVSTPAGNYTITITGTGTDPNAMTHSTQITLTVN